MSFSFIVAAVLLVAVLFGVEPATQPRREITLREAAEGQFLIGAAVMSRSLAIPAFSELTGRQFSSLTGENEFKPKWTQPEPGKFTFEAAEQVVAFARQHDMKVIGHTLLWHQAEPDWMFADADGKPLPRERALANLKAHIAGVAGHFRGKVMGWDVVNEALSDREDEYLRDTPALRAIGDDYVIQAFKFAAEADPQAELYYNDYNIEQPGKRAKAIRLLKELKQAGAKVDAVGIQGHWRLDWPAPAVIDDAIAEFAALGLKVMITELDIDVLPSTTTGADLAVTEQAADPYQAGLPAEVSERLASRYAELFRLFRKHRDVITRVTFWGVYDGKSWLNNWPTKGRTNHPLLFDRDFAPKPAYDAVIDALTR